MNIEERIRTFIVEHLYFAEGAALSDDVSFLAEGIIDSMGAIELVTFVESEFGIRVDMSEVVVKDFDSIAKLANFVRHKLALGPKGTVRPLQVAADALPPSARPPVAFSESDGGSMEVKV